MILSPVCILIFVTVNKSAAHSDSQFGEELMIGKWDEGEAKRTDQEGDSWGEEGWRENGEESDGTEMDGGVKSGPERDKNDGRNKKKTKQSQR